MHEEYQSLIEEDELSESINKATRKNMAKTHKVSSLEEVLKLEGIEPGYAVLLRELTNEGVGVMKFVNYIQRLKATQPTSKALQDREALGMKVSKEQKEEQTVDDALTSWVRNAAIAAVTGENRYATVDPEYSANAATEEDIVNRGINDFYSKAWSATDKRLANTEDVKKAEPTNIKHRGDLNKVDDA